MKLFFICMVFSIITFGDSRPQHLLNRRSVSQEKLSRAGEEAATHFGFNEDYKKLNLPLGKQSGAEHGFNSTNDGSGNYYFQFETFGLKRYEVGELKNPGTDQEIQVVKGRYYDRVVNDDGVHIVREIGYVADENGYRPFLISISFVLSTAQRPPPMNSKSGISGTVLAT